MKWADIPTDKKRLYVFSAAMSAVLLSMLFIPRGSILLVSASVLLVLSLGCFLLLKKRGIPSVARGQVLLILSVCGILYISILYLLGTSFGFWRSTVPITIKSFFTYVLTIAIIIVGFEFIRGALLSSESRIAYVAAYFCGIVSELIINFGFSGTHNFAVFMNVIGLVFLPAISENFLYNYVAKRYGIYPNIAYRLLISLYPYIIPFVPAVPDALHAFLNVCVPLFIFGFLSVLYEKKRKYAAKKKAGIISFSLSALSLIICCAFVMLISCKFKYGLLVIATESMTGSINKGDAIVYEEYDRQIIKEGDVIVFKRDDSRIVHRVVEITRTNGQNKYYTMGDANPGRDEGFVTDADVLGVTQFRVKSIGHPTLWLRSIFD